MSLTVGELKKVSVQSIRDISAGLRAKSASMHATKAGVTDLPHKGTWTGVAADNADHEIGHFATGVGRDADAYEDAAKKADRAGDEFEGLKQLLAKLENEAAGKFSINESTGEVTPLTKDFNKSDRDYIAATIKQLCAAGGQANDELAAAIHATDGATTPASASAPGGPLAPMPGSAIKPDGVAGGLQNLAGPNPDGDPGATKAAAAGTDTEAKYKEWYPKNGVSVGDKNVDPSKLGGVGALPGVGDIDKAKAAKLAPTLQPKDVPAFKDLTRQNLQRQGVPADQIEQRVNDAVTRAQTPHFMPDAPAAGNGNADLSKSPGQHFIDLTNDAHEGFYQSADGTVQQGKELTGQAGPGAPGVAEAWKEFGVNSGKALFDQSINPIGSALDEAQRAVNDPGHFAGQKLFEVTAAAPTLPLGGEGAAIERGLAGDLTHNIGDVTSGNHPLPQVDHPHPTGDHASVDTSHHGTGDIDHHNFDVTPDTSHDLYHADNGIAEPRPYNENIEAYPHAYHPGTGDEMPFPPGDLDRIPKDQRFEWTNMDRYYYIKQWHDMGYETPPGGWNLYDIHHVKPREFGGDNSFENLIPVPRSLHNQSITPWWRNFG